jgi:hypothetical protein
MSGIAMLERRVGEVGDPALPGPWFGWRVTGDVSAKILEVSTATGGRLLGCRDHLLATRTVRLCQA